MGTNRLAGSLVRVIDLQQLRADPDRVRASQRARGEDEALVDALLEADESRRAAVAAGDAVRAESNAASKEVRSASPDDRPALIARAKELSGSVKQAETEESAAEAVLRDAHLAVSNIIEEGAPPGGADDYVVLEEVGAKPAFDFETKDHLELGQLLKAIDTDRGAKVAGARFYYLTGVGALLQLGLLRMGLDQAVGAGFTPAIPPVLVRPEVMEGTGFLGQAAENVYHLAEDDLYLVGTSEAPLAGYHMDEILDANSLPLRYVGWSSCFRREAGSYGQDVRGIVRVHQFDKVEMFSYVHPDEAQAEHQRLLAWEREMLDKCELPYRVIDVAAGDLGASAARKFDCEAWVPSQSKYREMTSTSNCTDFQARRLNIRIREERGTRPVATLNGTLATTRWLVAILENHQRSDGSVRVPEALVPYVGRDVLEPVT
ncbi:MAG: seryl-tRNA synthetase [Frankiales bacterium]|jgi:seryl-tRNA synthetase|nr:seryl-tRNA synthetase [Frankiales bacterium]